MVIFLIILLGISIYKVRFANFHQDYMDRGQTGAIKGFFAIIVLFSHLRQYLNFADSFWDNSFLAFIRFLGQLMVTLFFFYSGYGVLKAYKEKPNYKQGFFRKRILKTLVHFDLVVILYIVLSFIIKANYGWEDYLLSLIGWSAVGNSNWFIFVTLALYMCTQLAFLLVKKNRPIIITGLVCVLSCALFLFLYFAGKESWWMDTIFCYSAGMIFACIETRVSDVMSKSKLYNYGLVLLCAVGFFISYYYLEYFVPYVIAQNVTAVLFCLFVVMLLTKIKIDNFILRWLGRYSFLIYICQRLPMIVLSTLNVTNTIVFTILSILLTIGISILINMVYERVDKFCFK